MTPSPATGFFEVQGRSRFQLSGPDATRYLNGQVSIDITRLKPLTARPACLLTAKGKLCALVKVWRDGDNLLIECDEALAEAVQARLERYLIADDALLEPVSAPPPLHHIFGIEPPAGALCINRTGLPGFDTVEKPSDLTAATPAQLALLRIVHGQPAWGIEITEDTLPHEAHLEDTAVDFDKGCYVGQETVSRLKSVGRVNKRLHGFLGTLPANLPLPIRLHPIGQPATTAGHLTSTAPHFDIAQTAALGYLNRQFEDLERFGISDEQGRPLGEVERRALPIL
ncbi:MAG: tRNA-modifying protein YgfZ [Proteobacteria bacterium]|nr:tRNA-modifying protein YgfZ [Pseudomonadota bacterium]